MLQEFEIGHKESPVIEDKKKTRFKRNLIPFDGSRYNLHIQTLYFKQHQLPWPLKGLNINVCISKVNHQKNRTLIEASKLGGWTLVSLGLLLSAACGQRSSLTIPSDEEAKNRASLPQIIFRQGSAPQQPADSTKVAPKNPAATGAQ